MRVTVLLLVALVTLSALFNLDAVLGAFAAGFVLRYIIPEGNNSLEHKLDGIAFGFSCHSSSLYQAQRSTSMQC